MNLVSCIGTDKQKLRLIVSIRDALRIADELNCDIAAIHLNAALVNLSGGEDVPDQASKLGCGGRVGGTK